MHLHFTNGDKSSNLLASDEESPTSSVSNESTEVALPSSSSDGIIVSSSEMSTGNTSAGRTSPCLHFLAQR